MTDPKSQADLLREHIGLKLDQNFDYSNASNTTADIISFCDKNRDRKYSAKNVRPAHSRILNEILKNRGIDPQSLGKTKRTLKFNKDLNATITPKPVEGSPDTSTSENKKEIKQEIGKDGKPIQTINAPPSHNYEHFDAAGVGATFQAFVLMFRVALPEMEGLTDEEKKSLGNMWLPAFQRYLTENWAYIGIPLFGTLGILLPKIVEARKKHKINEENKERTQLTEKANKEEAERNDKSKVECPYCKQKFSELGLQNHKPNCKDNKHVS